jgi:hypothetical protein
MQKLQLLALEIKLNIGIYGILNAETAISFNT